MRVDNGRQRRLPVQLRWALLIQLALLLAGLALLALGAGPGWLLLLLLALSLGSVAVAAWALPAEPPVPLTPAIGPRLPPPAAAPPAPTGSGDEQLRRRLQSLEEDLVRCDQRVGRLAAGRARAREESRLKSDYLTLLGRELSPLREQVEALLQEPADAAPGSRRATLEELRDRLGDLEVLLEGIAGSEPPPAAAAPAAAPAPPVRRGRRLLIVDDGPVNLMLARQVLEREGYEVRTATSGAEALACLEQVPFDLVLMDIFMPGMDGVETSRRWRDVEIERYPGKRSVLVALTANASAEDRKRFVAAGLDDYLAKPYRPQQLIDLVNRWLPPSREEVPHP